MATGYMVAPISKLPFLNIMTDVLLMQVPEEKDQRINEDSYEMCVTAQLLRGRTLIRPIFGESQYKTTVHPTPFTLTLWKY